MRLDQLLQSRSGAFLTGLIIAEMHGNMIGHETNKRTFGRRVLTADKNVGSRQGDEVDDYVKGRKTGRGVVAGQSGGETLFGLGGGERPFGVEDKPEGHFKCKKGVISERELVLMSLVTECVLECTV